MGDLICLQIAAEELGFDFSGLIFLIEKRSELWAKSQNLNFICYDRMSIKLCMLILRGAKEIVNTEQYFGLSMCAGLLLKSYKGSIRAYKTNRAQLFADQIVAYDPYDQHEVLSFKSILSLNKVFPATFRIRKEKTQDYILFAIAGEGSVSRNLDFSIWQRILAAHGEVKKVLVAAPAQKPLLNQLQSIDPHVLMVSTEFIKNIELIKSAKEVVTIDSGIVHVCSYFGVPTQALFTSGRDKKWAPLARGSKIIKRTDLDCQPCTLFGQVPPCQNNFKCKDIADVLFVNDRV